MKKFKKKLAFNQIYLLLLGFICVIFISISYFGLKNDGLTIDETAHIVSGYEALHQNFSINLEHPPLIKMIASIGLLPLNLSYKYNSALISANQWSEGTKFLFDNSVPLDTILTHARMSLIIFYAICIFMIGLLLKSIFKNYLGLVATFLAVFEPNILAHSKFVTTDAGIAYLTLISFCLTYLLIKEQKIKCAIFLGTALSLTLLSKFSGLATVVFSFLTFLLFSGFKKEKFILILRNFLTAFGAFFILSFSIYFYANLKVNPDFINSVSYFNGKRERIEKLSNNILTRPILSYYTGYRSVSIRSEEGPLHVFPQYLNNDFKTENGWWYYFPLAFMYKETLPIIILFLISIFYFLKDISHKKFNLFSTLLLTFIFAYSLICAKSALNIGIRHITPILILIPVFSIFVLKDVFVKIRYGNLIISILIFLQVFILTYNFPFYLSYFNLLARGSKNGYNHLIDSNLDWGENMKRLYGWAIQENVSTIYVDYWGKTPLNYYDKSKVFKQWGLDYGRPNGYLAINPQWIAYSKWLKKTGRVKDDYSYLESIKPIARIGGGIFIYDLNKKQ